MSNSLAEEHEGGEGEASGERWLLTYADLITLLMAFFVMMYSMSQVNQLKFDKAAASMRRQFHSTKVTSGGGGPLPMAQNMPSMTQEGDSDVESMEEDLQSYIDAKGLQDLVRVSEDPRGLVISLVSDNLMFAAGQAELQTNSLALLDRIAGILKRVPNSVLVEGHTCNLPISNVRFPSNWELSAARACSVVRYLSDREGVGAKRLSAVGYGESRPVASNGTEEGRARNRRVDLVILAPPHQIQSAKAEEKQG